MESGSDSVVQIGTQPAKSDASVARHIRIGQLLDQAKQPRYRLDQIIDFVFSKGIFEFEKMSTLPKGLRDLLIESFGPSYVKLKPLTTSDSDQAIKTLFELGDEKNNRLEAVELKFEKGNTALCISSQVGCGLGCSFCATGKVGFQRNLTVDEVTDQVLFHRANARITSVAFMGMGEPLANPNVFEALKELTNPKTFNISDRRLGVSTSGVIPGIRRMTAEVPFVRLAFSLHSPFHEQRNELVPLNKRFPFNEVLEVLDEHVAKTKRQVFLAYLVLNGVNDSPDHINELIKIVKGRGKYSYLYIVNLLRYNPAFGIGDSYPKTSEETLLAIKQQLGRAGILATIRQSFGKDIDAACGQLYAKYKAKQKAA